MVILEIISEKKYHSYPNNCFSEKYYLIIYGVLVFMPGELLEFFENHMGEIKN